MKWISPEVFSPYLYLVSQNVPVSFDQSDPRLIYNLTFDTGLPLDIGLSISHVLSAE